MPLTLPSHASLFTGTYPMFHGIRDFTGHTLGRERTTLATMLESAGYRTGAVVGSAVLEARWGINQGFNFYYDNFPPPAAQNWHTIAERRGDEVVRESLKWLEKNKAGPFFLWVHLYDPHDPYTPPPPFDRQYASRPYDGEIAYTDGNVGRIVDALKQGGLYDDCLIVLLSDHGESLGEHGEKTHGLFIYDSTLRIPLVFKLPGKSAPRGTRLAGPLRIIDVLPTVLEALGIQAKVRAPEVQGLSAYTALLGKASLPELLPQAESMLPFYQFDWSPLHSIRRGRYKFIESSRPELFDTVADPGEKRNLFDENKVEAERLKAFLRQVTARFSPLKGAKSRASGIDAATAEKLASLGYLAARRRSTEPPVRRNLPDAKDRVEVYNLIMDGTDAARGADYGRASKLLAEAAKREPDNLVAHFQLGVVHRVIGDLAQAEREFLRTLELRPGYDLALRRLAEIYMADRRYAEAEAAFVKVVEQAPDDYLGYFNLGGLYVTVDRWDDALAAFRKAQTLNSRDILIPMVLSRVLMKKGDLTGALAAVQQALKLDPNLASGHETAREIYQILGRTAEAEREAQILQRLRSKR
jgi:arylsulfatase A-like enzyme/Flp pilus assembly protein TadD